MNNLTKIRASKFAVNCLKVYQQVLVNNAVSVQELKKNLNLNQEDLEKALDLLKYNGFIKKSTPETPYTLAEEDNDQFET